MLSTTFVLFYRPLAFFTDNICIDRPKNHKARLEVDCIIFYFQIITSFHIPHNNFKTLTLPSKLQRGKYQENFSQILDPWLFSDLFPASFLQQFFSRNPTQAHISGFSHQTKIYRTCAHILPLWPARRYFTFGEVKLNYQKDEANYSLLPTTLLAETDKLQYWLNKT